MNELLVIALAVFIASTIQALTGFGFSLFLLPVLMLFYPSHEAVLLSLVLTVFSYSLMMWFIYAKVNFRAVSAMLLTSIPGIILGAMIFSRVNALLLRNLVGIIIVSFSLILLFRRSFPLRNERLGSMIAGFYSGILSCLLSTPGPPVVLFAVNQEYPKEVFRASLGAFFLVVTPISILVHIFSNNYLTLPLVWQSLSFIPAILLGNALGMRLFPHIPKEHLRTLVLLILLFLGLATFRP